MKHQLPKGFSLSGFLAKRRGLLDLFTLFSVLELMWLKPTAHFYEFALTLQIDDSKNAQLERAALCSGRGRFVV